MELITLTAYIIGVCIAVLSVGALRSFRDIEDGVEREYSDNISRNSPEKAIDSHREVDVTDAYRDAGAAGRGIDDSSKIIDYSVREIPVSQRQQYNGNYRLVPLDELKSSIDEIKTNIHDVDGIEVVTDDSSGQVEGYVFDTLYKIKSVKHLVNSMLDGIEKDPAQFKNNISKRIKNNPTKSFMTIGSYLNTLGGILELCTKKYDELKVNYDEILVKYGISDEDILDTIHSFRPSKA